MTRQPWHPPDIAPLPQTRSEEEQMEFLRRRYSGPPEDRHIGFIETLGACFCVGLAVGAALFLLYLIVFGPWLDAK